MSWQLFFALLAFLGVIAGLLFLSMIHIFMIPKDVMDRDTGKKQEPGQDERNASGTKESGDVMIATAADPREKPEVPEKPEPKPEQPATPEPDKNPAPEIEREPGQRNDQEPEKDPGRI